MELTADEDLGQPSRREIVLGVVRVLAGFVLLVSMVALLGWAYRAPLERFGHWFVERFGIAGMAAGAFLADGCHFPLPPQFYLFTGVAAGVPTTLALGAVTIGSIAGGTFAFVLARRVGRVRFFEKQTATTRVLVEHLLRRYGTWGMVIAGILPISYFALCALVGIMRSKPRHFAVLALMRIPRLVLSWWLIAAAWGL